MEILEAIRNRRSIRSFKSTPVPKKVLEEFLENCLWAPSRVVAKEPVVLTPIV